MNILQSFNQQLSQLPVRITLVFAAIFLCVALFTSSIVLDYLQDNVVLIREEYGRQILQMAQADALAASSDSAAGSTLASYAAALFAELGTFDAAIYDANGQLIAAAAPSSWPARLPAPTDEGISHSQVEPAALLDSTPERALLLYQPVQLNSTTSGWQAIRLELNNERTLSDALYTRFLVGMALTLALIIASGVYLRSYTRRNLQPLLNLTQKIGQTNWDAELSTRVSGEFRELGDGIAEMKANLAAFEAQRRTLLDRISHDILSPLKTIAMIASFYPSTPQTVEENDWQIVYICANHVTRLLEDLKYLMNRRIDILPAGPSESIAVEPVVEQVLTYYRTKSSGRKLNFVFEPTAGAPACTPMEATRLMQLLGNLLDNAITHGRATEIAVQVNQARGEQIQLAVRDNGVGIAPEHRPRIFDERYSTAKGQGTNQGLGLAIVKDIVHLHNGKIEVESEVGRGTTFRIWLPLGECNA